MNYKGITGSYTGPQGQTWSTAFARIIGFIHEISENKVTLQVGVWETESQYDAYPKSPAVVSREMVFDAFLGLDGQYQGATSYTVTGVSLANDKFIVSGDKTLAFIAGAEFSAVNGSNNGDFTVLGVSYNAGITSTEIICNESLSSDTADGSLLVKNHYSNHFTETVLNQNNVNHKTKAYEFLLLNIAKFSGFAGVSA